MRRHVDVSFDTDSTAKAEGVDEGARGMVERALRAGSSKRWMQSKISLVGEGRAGKTTLLDSLAGKGAKDWDDASQNKSTVGVATMTLQCKSLSVGEVGWVRHVASQCLAEEVLASLVAAQLAGEGADGEAESMVTHMEEMGAGARQRSSPVVYDSTCVEEEEEEKSAPGEELERTKELERQLREPEPEDGVVEGAARAAVPAAAAGGRTGAAAQPSSPAAA